MASHKELKAFLEKHSKRQQDIIESFRKALLTAREKTRNTYKEKRNKTQQEINDLKTKQNQVIKDLMENETKHNDKLLGLWTEWEFKMRSVPQQQTDSKRSQELKTESMGTIWKETVREIDVILERQKQSIINLSGRPIESLMSSPLMRPQATDTSQRLSEIRKEIDKTCKEIEDNDREETKALEKIIDRNRKLEAENRRKAWEAFFKKNQRK